MKILIAGSSGLVGTALITSLKNKGHFVSRLHRSSKNSSDDEILWDPEKNEIPLKSIENFDGIVNLAGESIAAGRWTEEKKKRIYNSRIGTTELLAKALTQLKNPPKVFINSSAIGIYGDRKDEWLNEESHPGTGFLVHVCQDWEAATAPASGVSRVVKLRTGMVLSENGGALPKMLLPFKLGLGGRIGSGKQWMSWIALDDLVSVIEFALNNPSVQGAVNAVSPNPVTNEEFTKVLGETLHRPTLLPVPAFAVRLAFGEMGDELLLASAKVLPQQLLDANYPFLYPKLDLALKHLIT